MTFDLDRIRKDFPALEQGIAYFDGPGGTQVPRQVAEAVAAAMTSGISNRGLVTDAERRAEDVVVGARGAVADLLGCDPGGVVFARSMTQATYDVSRALAKEWVAGDEVVVTRLDHDSNVRPWVQAAATAGAELRWVGFDRETAELSVDDVRAELSGRTKLVAVTGASNVLGTRPDLPAIADVVHEAGALLYVDGVHLTPHAPVDVAALGADFYACSPYKFFGPHHGIVVAAPELLERIHPDKLLPSTDEVPERFELGTLPYELLAGTTAAVDYIAGLASEAADRRTRVLESMRAVEEYEDELLERLLDGLRQIPRRHPARRSTPAHADGVLLGRRPRRPGRLRAPRDGRGQRPGQQLLRDRGVPVAGPRRHRRGAGGAGAVHQSRRHRTPPRGRRGGRPMSGRGVLVTGGSRGIGAAIARAFAAQGDRVAVHYGSSAEAAARVAAELPGDGHVTVQADLPDPEAVRRAVDLAAERLGRLDVLVNNAGVFIAHPPLTTAYDEWQETWSRTLSTNLIGAANAAYCAIPHLRAAGGGAIVNVSSRGAFRGEPANPAYAASKAGMNAFGQSLAIALAPEGITVGMVAPGFVQTEMAREVLDGPGGDAVRAQSPFGRVARPEEVAAAVLWLASPEARFSTGTIIDVNGASYLRS